MLQKLRGNNSKGFTLIELMIVIAIIGILAAIAIPNFISYRNKSYCSRAETDAQNVLASMASYYADPDHSAIPTISELMSLEKLILNNPNDTQYSVTGPDWAVIMSGDDLNKCPYDRDGERFYVYFGTAGTSGWE